MAAAVTTSQPTWFEGYYVPSADSSEPINCATTEFFSVSGDYAGCCPTDSSCQIITSCADGTVTGTPGAIGCLSPGGCVTMSVFDSYPSGGLLNSVLICADNWAASTIYRTVAAAATTTSSASTSTSASSSSKSISSSASTQSSATTGSSATVASQTSNATAPPSSSGSPSSGGGSASQAWIAGAVIGPIAVLALIILAFWLGRRSSHRRAAQGHIAAFANQASKGPQEMAGSTPGLYMNHQAPSELPDNSTGYQNHGMGPQQLSAG